MNRLAETIINKRTIILVAFVLFAIISACFIPSVQVNYNLSEYLPQDMTTSRAMDVMEKEFSLTGTARVMVDDVSLPEATALKERIEAVNGVKSVIWLDDVADIHKPLEFLDQKTVKDYYKEKTAIYYVEFSEDDYSLNTGKAVSEIQSVIGNKGSMGGSAVNTKAMRENTIKEILSATAIAAPLILLILLLTTQSWFEPVIYLLVLGISVLINMGTNAIFGRISFITNSSAAILQFAISMDYSIFVLHRFIEERNRGLGVHEAMKEAIVHSFSSIGASCLTTVAGFVALMFMRYHIGMDMGLVLGKGVILSLISVIFLLPGVTILTYKLIEGSRHKSFLPSLTGIAKGIFKFRYVLLVIMGLLLVPTYLAQKSNSFLYGESAITTSAETKVGKQQNKIEGRYGIYNPAVLMIPKGDISAETGLARDLEKKEYVSSVQALVTLADPTIPREILPDNVIENFTSENYSRMIINLNLPVESAATFKAVGEINSMVRTYYGDKYYLLGSSTSVSDIKQVVDKDFNIVNLISIAAVALIILITFRSISLPLLLILVIEASIWINMSIPYFMDDSFSFIGYMIVSAVQLGATIDYAILIANRYMHNRVTLGKKDSAVKALGDSGWSVITSALVLFVAGMGVSIVSSIRGVSELGLLIGRGGALSGLMVLVMLPQILILFDGLIHKTTMKRWS